MGSVLVICPWNLKKCAFKLKKSWGNVHFFKLIFGAQFWYITSRRKYHFFSNDHKNFYPFKIDVSLEKKIFHFSEKRFFDFQNQDILEWAIYVFSKSGQILKPCTYEENCIKINQRLLRTKPPFYPINVQRIP